MEQYSFLRQLADSWALLALFFFFLGVVAWVWRPGSRKVHDEIANSIFRNEDRPKEDKPTKQDKPREDANGK